jgi:hypothetical protein
MPEEYQGDSGGVLGWAAGVVGKVYDAVMEGGQVQAFFRQGADEIGVALKAFPDSIHVDEPGTVFNPLFRNMPGDLPSPSQIVSDPTPYLPPPDQGNVYGQEMGREM